MKTTLTPVEALARIAREADEKQIHETRTIARIDVGKVVRQGDIYVHRVADDHPRGQPFKGRQLVRGVTVGSRHEALAPARIFEGVQAPEWAPRALVGPVVVSPKRRVRITHPEHAWVDLPAGVYQITYQLDARTGGQVQD